MGLNKMLERINGGEKALGAFMYTPDEEVVELCGRLGFDFFNFDAQHTAIPPATIERMCRVADGYAMAAVMRLPDGEESTILSYLDRGVSGIVIPNLETREQAESLVKYAKFAPQGLRSFTSLRVAKFGLHEGDLRSLMEEVNANTIPMPMFESITALDNLDEILSVPGYEYFGGPGPNDLAQSLGLVGEPDHPKVKEVVEQATEKIHAAGKRWFSEVTEMLNLAEAVSGAAKELLRKHGR